MAKKRRKIENVKVQTVRHITRREREKKIQRIVLIVGGVFLALVLAFMAYGFYDSQYKPYNQTVLEVNGTKVNMNYYLNMLKIYLTGSDPSQASMIGQAAPGAIENNLIIIQKSPELGFTVKPDEIDKEINDRKLPNEQVYRDIYESVLLQDQMDKDYFGKDVPETADQVKASGIVLESEPAALSAIEGLGKGMPFVEMAKMFGIEKVTNDRGGDLGWLPKGLISRVLGYADATTLENNVFTLEPNIISQPIYDSAIMKDVGYWLLKVEEKDGPESCHARAMLLGSAAEAGEMKKRIETGEDFATLAKEYSQDTSNKEDGGDLGWVRKGYSNNYIEEAFNLEVGQVSEPIRDITVETKGGYWVIKVLEKESNRAIDTAVRDQMISEKFSVWLQKQKETSEIKNYLTPEQQQWAIDKASRDLSAKGK